MRRPLLVALLVWSGAPSPVVAAQCDLIRDPDARAYCRATREDRPQNCDLIADHDQRAFCRARTGSVRGCDLIAAHDLRALCRAGR